MNKHNKNTYTKLKNNCNYKNIYLFASSYYNNSTQKCVNKFKISEDDGIVLFNSPHNFVKNFLKETPIDYCFCRAFDHHLNRSMVAIVGKYNFSKCKLVQQSRLNNIDKVENIFTDMKSL